MVIIWLSIKSWPLPNNRNQVLVFFGKIDLFDKLVFYQPCFSWYLALKLWIERDIKVWFILIFLSK